MIARKLIETQELEQAEQLLRDNKLPTADLESSDVALYGFFEDGQLIATGGIELVEGYRMIRSLAVRESDRGKSLGQRVVEYLVELVEEEGFDMVYLITEIPAYFEQLGFQATDRDSIPDAIRETEEFSVLCPDTAAIMKLSIV